MEFRDHYLSTAPPPGRYVPRLLYKDDDFSNSALEKGNAGPLATLFWNTSVLCQRSVMNYSRNLLAYGVRVGMYAGMSLWPNTSGASDSTMINLGMGLMIA